MVKPNTAERIARLRNLARSADLDAILVSQPESRYYLSGYSGHDLPPRDSAGYLLITQNRLLLLTDGRTSEQAAAQAPDYEVIEIQSGIADALRNLAGDLGVQAVGFEGIHLPYQLADEIRTALGERTFRNTGGMLDSLRIKKDEAELDELRRAIAVSDACVDHLIGWLQPGMTEKEVAWEVELFTRRNGGDDLAFDTIVATGPNAAMPHAVPTDRKIGVGEPVIIDMGARVHHYNSDITRTVCLGQAPDWLITIYETVLEAQLRAEEQIQAGMTGREADALAREIIVAAGYGDRFRHSLGHGIGLEEHEPPRVSSRSDDRLEQGMVFSVEPGIYLPGVGGVRIEDLAWLAPSGIEVLTRAPKDRRLLHL